MRKILLIMSLSLLLASGCSLLSNSNLENSKSVNRHNSILFPLAFDEPTSIEPIEMSIADRIEKGIDMFYSPDRSLFYVFEYYPDRFHSITLGPKSRRKFLSLRSFSVLGLEIFMSSLFFGEGFQTESI